MTIYSNIVILGIFFVGGLLPVQGGTACGWAPPVLQAALPARNVSPAISDPPFLRHPIQFSPNSLELTVAGRNILKGAATWLRQHRDARILIVGSCDSGGSEHCTRALAEARGAVVGKFLGGSGIDSDQVVGVKGWDNLAQSCQTSDSECQQFNRSARIFLASSVAP